MLRRVTTVLAFSMLAGACGDDHGATDAALEPDAAPPCTPQACPWLLEMQEEIVARLSGELPIADGVSLSQRATVEEREAVRTYLLAQLEALGVPASAQPYEQPEAGINIVAELAATDGGDDGIVVIGAHFDSVPGSPAAADNATGVAMVLAMARYLRDQPRAYTTRFVLFDQEEIGLVGSNAYVAAMDAQGELPSLVGAHCFDMLSFDGDGDAVVELWSPTPAMAALYEQAADELGLAVEPVAFGLSDHQAFLDAGLPATGIGEEFVGDDHTPHYHLATDTYDKIDFAYLDAATRLGFAALTAQLAPS